MGIVGENFYSTTLAQEMKVSYDDDNIHSPHDNEFFGIEQTRVGENGKFTQLI